MTIVADENIDFPIIIALRNAGYEVYSIVEQTPGIKDNAVLEQSFATSSILLTEDKDFGEHVYRIGSQHSGVVLIRLFNLSLDLKIRLLLEAFKSYADDFLNAFSVIEPGKVRILKK